MTLPTWIEAAGIGGSFSTIYAAAISSLPDVSTSLLARGWLGESDAAGLQPAVVPKLRRIVSFLQDMGREEELRTVPNWKAHQLTGDRKDTWSLFVTNNWRMTFRIDQEEIEIVDLDYEDYD